MLTGKKLRELNKQAHLSIAASAPPRNLPAFPQTFQSLPEASQKLLPQQCSNNTIPITSKSLLPNQLQVTSKSLVAPLLSQQAQQASAQGQQADKKPKRARQNFERGPTKFFKQETLPPTKKTCSDIMSRI